MDIVCKPTQTDAQELHDPEHQQLKKQLASQEREIERLRKDLDIAEQKLAHGLSAKMAFLNNMNHEIRTPMNGIIGMSALLAESDLSPRQHSHNQIILESARGLFRVLEDTMDLAELEANQLTLNPERFNFHEMASKVLTTMAPLAAEKNIELIGAIDEDMPETLISDAGRIKQILQNLISIAIKFTEKGHVYASGNVLSRHGEFVTLRFEVIDTGGGLTHDLIDELFSLKQNQIQRKDFGHHGTGLSLSISRRLVGLFRGKMGAEPDIGHGSKFWFEIPVYGAEGVREVTTRAGHCAVFQANLPNDDYLSHLLTSLYGSLQQASSLQELTRWAEDPKQSFSKFLVDVDALTPDEQNYLFEFVANSPLDSKRWVMLCNENDDVANRSYANKVHGWSVIARPWSRFKLRIALTQNTAHDFDPLTVPSHQPLEKGQTQPRQNPHILLVEDNRVNQMVAKAILNKLNAKVTIANDGIEAIEQYLEHEFDLVLMDISMPRMDGVEATCELKNMMNAGAKRVPVVALTANAMSDSKEKYLSLGLDDYLAKPFQAPQLKRILDKWLLPKNRNL
ncbi:response regulator [Leucothrix mucor]|uniref:response regulator n=1 Tax=Leucothrix mucor TaxID=45248 RepID=UPI0003B4FD82|nr:response regulator [Leucothrix mucor]